MEMHVILENWKYDLIESKMDQDKYIGALWDNLRNSEQNPGLDGIINFQQDSINAIFL